MYYEIKTVQVLSPEVNLPDDAVAINVQVKTMVERTSLAVEGTKSYYWEVTYLIPRHK